PADRARAGTRPRQGPGLGAEEQGSPHQEVLGAAAALGGRPVVVADLHSAVPAVLAALRADRPGVTVAYLMLDGGALPAWFSRTIASLREAGWLAGPGPGRPAVGRGPGTGPRATRPPPARRPAGP